MLQNPQLHYLDNAATTIVAPEVADVIDKAMREHWANPSSLYGPGARSEEALNAARAAVARTLGCKSRELYFTSCGSESNNLALLGAVQTRTFGKGIVVSGFEHPSVQRPLERLAKQGYELMDKKRNILIRELMNLIEEAKTIQSEIDATFTEAYQALQQANIEVGIHSVQEIAKAIPAEDSVRIKTRSIMGTEIPLVSCEEEKKIPYYGFYNSSESVDAARESFLKVKELTGRLSMVENSAYRLAMNIRKTQKRANALKNITIPSYTILVKDISNALEEKEREEFTRLKVIKRNMNH